MVFRNMVMSSTLKYLTNNFENKVDTRGIIYYVLRKRIDIININTVVKISLTVVHKLTLRLARQEGRFVIKSAEDGVVTAGGWL